MSRHAKTAKLIEDAAAIDIRALRRVHRQERSERQRLVYTLRDIETAS